MLLLTSLVVVGVVVVVFRACYADSIYVSLCCQLYSVPIPIPIITAIYYISIFA